LLPPNPTCNVCPFIATVSSLFSRDFRTRRFRQLQKTVLTEFTYSVYDVIKQLIARAADALAEFLTNFDDGVTAIGSGGPYAHAAAKALTQFSDLEARAIVEEAMKIAASICIFTNDRIAVEEL
jgi:ATP-dependent protease HslVU (ClpYQ) peptidase subunit